MNSMFEVQAPIAPLHCGAGISSYRIQAAPLASWHLPPHPGSMLRGLLGHALLARLCRCNSQLTHQPDCQYLRIFEGLRREQQDGIPALLITPLHGNRRLKAGEPFDFRLTLLGLPQSLQAEVISALAAGLRAGLGPQAMPCELLSCTPLASAITPLSQTVELELTTPWLIKRKGQPLRAAQIRIHDILVALAQRQRMINRHFAFDLAIPDNTTVLQLADQLEVHATLHDVCWERHSSRQARRHPLAGVQGHLKIRHPEACGLHPLSALLSFGALLHGGGKTSFGLGGLRLDTSLAAITLGGALPGTTFRKTP